MKKTILAAGVLLLSCLLPLKASAAKFDKLYVFGDSISDTGNVFNATLSTTGTGFPPPPYYQGRFSNGLNWVDYLGQDLGLNPIPYTNVLAGANPTQGINYAFGGATTGTDNTISTSLLGLKQEINAFTTTNPTADPNALYIVWAGGNDYLPTSSTTFVPFQQTTQPINNILQGVNSLIQVGAKNIMVVNLPDLGKVPLTVGSSNSGALTTLSNAHNSALVASLNSLQSTNNGVRIIPFDVNSVFNQVINNPAQYGFTNVTNGCLLVGCTTPNQYLFWDGIHPTTAADKIVADSANSAISAIPEPSAGWGILLFGALGVGKVLQREVKKGSTRKSSR